MKHSYAAIATALSSALLASGCSAAPDRAGGDAEEQVRVLTYAVVNIGGPSAAETEWADDVKRLSDGALQIEFKSAWRRGEPQQEQGVLADLREGKVALGGVRARALDREGYLGFQALVAPFLVDSYALESAVFDSGIVDDMLAGVTAIDVVGIAVLPSSLYRVTGKEHAFAGPDDFRGQILATQDSAMNEATMKSLGATPHFMASSSDIRAYDGYTAPPGAVAGNSYQSFLRHLAGNLSLGIQPSLILMGKVTEGSLDEEQRKILREAASDVRAAAIRASQEDDRVGMSVLCNSSVEVSFASAEDLQDLRKAVTPVYDQLRQDPQSAEWLGQITALKIKTAAAPDVATCPDTPTPASTDLGIPDGTYVRTRTKEDLERAPYYLSWYPPGTSTLTFRRGVMTKIDPEGASQSHTYTLFQGRIHAENNGPVDFIASYHLDGDKLTFTDFIWPDCTNCQPDESAYGGSDPWIRQ
ncbi:TRAP-type C4-dicarboxylate transport system substrate-binding protein [Micromonospora kangleipakensis]|uniref:TRAP-type C4-dicarboxylate transport system substrate-binding protein n=1 Tax=Micromonospora kangleipakensis TaxID=1077942 RepID=A0A4V2GDJ3_9ACTN|nr:TRAP transporter substrate-binding protein DctP [Micromonospora kangleipakensis]RZU76116.1 TRAP-type C4-dicarboxylate transport system substrate-binding protein [Micromonospora kangleipakensis]